jgi:TRAP-type C4-dicarboxylate transport system permease small subunit
MAAHSTPERTASDDDVEAFSEPSAKAPLTPFGWLVDGSNAVGSLLILALLVTILSDVVMRGLFNQPLHGVAELVGMSVIVVVFSQLASSARHGRMARAEIFIDGFRERSPRGGAALQAAWNLVALSVCGMIAYATAPKLLEAWRTAEFVGNEGLFTAPVWPMRAAVVIGASLTAVQYAVFLVRAIRRALGQRVEGYDGGSL